MTRMDEICLIIALMQRKATRLTHEHIRVRANTSLRQGNGQRGAATPTTPRANSAQVNTNPSKNRYALLDPDVTGTCNKIPETATTHGWTVVTHKRKPTTTSRMRNAWVEKQRAVANEVEAHVDESTCADAEVEAHVGTPTRGDAHPTEIEAHVNESTCGDVQAQAEAHAEIPARGDAHPSPIPSPDHGVTPLTGRLDAQSDVSGVARTRSPRMVQLLRRIREASNGGQTPHAPSNPDVPSGEQQSRPGTPAVKVSKNRSTRRDARPSSSTRTADVVPHEDDEKSDDEEALGCTDREELNENASRASRLREMRRQVRAVAAETSQAKGDEETTPSNRATTMNDTEGHNLPDDEQSSRQVHLQHPVDPVCEAERYCETLGLLTDEERHDAVSRYLMEGRWARKDEGDVSVEPTPDDLGEDNPIAAIDTLTDEERGELQEILSIDNTPLTKTDLGKILTQIRGRRNRDSPTTREVKTRPAINSADNDGRNDRPEVCEEETNPADTTAFASAPGPVQTPSARADRVYSRDLLTTIGGTTKGDASHNPRESSNRKDEATTPSENDPVIAIDTLSDEEREELQETLFADDTPLTKTELWRTLEQIKSRRAHHRSEALKDETSPAITTDLTHTPKSTQFPDARIGNIVMAGAVLDDEELWDAFTRDDREEALSRILDDDDVDDDPSRRSDTRYRSAYETLEDLDDMKDTLSNSDGGLVHWTYKAVDKDDKPSHNEEYDDDRDEYGVPSSRGDDDETWDCGEGNTLFDPSNGLTGWTCATEDLDDECETPLRQNEGDSREEITTELHVQGRAHDLTTAPATVPPFPAHDLATIMSSNLSDWTSSDSEVVREQCLSLHPRHKSDTSSHGEDDRHLPRESDDGEARHHVLPFINEGQYDVPPLVDEGQLKTLVEEDNSDSTGHNARHTPDTRDDDPVAITSTLPQSAPWLYFSHAYATVVGATNPLTRTHVGTRASRPMARPTNHGHGWPRAMSTQRRVALPDIPSCALGGRYGKSPSCDNCRPRPATGINHILPCLVIMEDNSLRGGVISRLLRFSPIPPISPTSNELANASNETTVLQNYRRITQPTKHDVVHNWKNTRRLKEMRVDPMRHEVHQVRSKGLDFQDANVAIQTVLAIYTHSQTRVDAGEYNGSAIPHSIAGQDNDVNYLGRLQLQLQKAMKTLESYHPKSSILIARYSGETDTDLDPTLGFYALELRKNENSTVRRNDNPPHTDAMGTPNEYSTVLTRYARPGHEQTPDLLTKEHEGFDHTLTQIDPRYHTGTCAIVPLRTPVDGGIDDKPKNTLTADEGTRPVFPRHTLQYHALVPQEDPGPESKIKRDDNPPRTHTAYKSYPRERLPVPDDAKNSTNEDSIVPTRHTASNHAQTLSLETEKREVVDCTSTRVNLAYRAEVYFIVRPHTFRDETNGVDTGSRGTSGGRRTRRYVSPHRDPRQSTVFPRTPAKLAVQYPVDTFAEIESYALNHPSERRSTLSRRSKRLTFAATARSTIAHTGIDTGAVLTTPPSYEYPTEGTRPDEVAIKPLRPDPGVVLDHDHLVLIQRFVRRGQDNTNGEDKTHNLHHIARRRPQPRPVAAHHKVVTIANLSAPTFEGNDTTTANTATSPASPTPSTTTPPTTTATTRGNKHNTRFHRAQTRRRTKYRSLTEPRKRGRVIKNWGDTYDCAIDYRHVTTVGINPTSPHTAYNQRNPSDSGQASTPQPSLASTSPLNPARSYPPSPTHAKSIQTPLPCSDTAAFGFNTSSKPDHRGRDDEVDNFFKYDHTRRAWRTRTNVQYAQPVIKPRRPQPTHDQDRFNTHAPTTTIPPASATPPNQVHPQRSTDSVPAQLAATPRHRLPTNSHHRHVPRGKPPGSVETIRKTTPVSIDVPSALMQRRTHRSHAHPTRQPRATATGTPASNDKTNTPSHDVSPRETTRRLRDPTRLNARDKPLRDASTDTRDTRIDEPAPPQYGRPTMTPTTRDEQVHRHCGRHPPTPHPTPAREPRNRAPNAHSVQITFATSQLTPRKIHIPSTSRIRVRYRLQKTAQKNSFGTNEAREGQSLDLFRFKHARVDFGSNNVYVRLDCDQAEQLEGHFTLQILCQSLEWQVPHMAQVLSQCFPIATLSSTGDLFIDTRNLRPGWKDVETTTKWQAILRPFTAVETLHISNNWGLP
ncbi:hypothetical protein EDB89DRAFT_2206376 [Lactarius sanguifluus]|nr:hypothetical protein EDB89DRAFT_2206376 [Lactarius sanguifluus]